MLKAAVNLMGAGGESPPPFDEGLEPGDDGEADDDGEDGGDEGSRVHPPNIANSIIAASRTAINLLFLM